MSAKFARRALKQSREAVGVVTVPLGRRGFNVVSDWRTVYMVDFKKHRLNARANAEANERLKNSLSRPTAPVGAIAPSGIVAA